MFSGLNQLILSLCPDFVLSVCHFVSVIQSFVHHNDHAPPALSFPLYSGNVLLEDLNETEWLTSALQVEPPSKIAQC